MERLPLEIILNIVEHSKPRDALQLVSTCTSFRTLLRYVLPRVTVKYDTSYSRLFSHVTSLRVVDHKLVDVDLESFKEGLKTLYIDPSMKDDSSHTLLFGLKASH
jgi:hypothetical protein